MRARSCARTRPRLQAPGWRPDGRPAAAAALRSGPPAGRDAPPRPARSPIPRRTGRPLQIAEGATGRDIVHLWPACIIASGLMLATRCMNATQARQSMDWEVFICIAFAFAVSTAMEKTNVALGIAEVFAYISEHL